ncbi:hypothetical protein BH11MYX4_BH11MYX4_02340 [soil metagenome]
MFSSFRIKDAKVTDLPPPQNLGLQGIDERLAACEESLAPFAREPYIAPLILAIDAVRAPLPVMRDYAREAMFSFLKTAGATRAAADAASAEVAKKKTGFSTPREREDSIADAARGVSGAVWDSVVRETIEAKREQGEKFAKDAVEALREADRAITASVSEFTGPLAFSAPITMDRLALITGLRDELRTMKPTAYGPLLDGFLASGNAEREMLFVQSVVPILDELAKLSLVQLGKRLEMRPASGGTGGALEKEQLAIHAMRRRLQERREEHVPEALKLAQLSFAQITAAFSKVFGWHAAALSQADYESRYLRGGQTPNPLDVHPAWMARAIDGCSVDDPTPGRR